MHCGYESYGFCFPYQGSIISCDRKPAFYPYGFTLTKFNAAGSTEFMFDEWDTVHGLGYCAAVIGTDQYNCIDLCTDRNKVCTNSAVRNMCDGTCDFCSLLAAVAANVTKTKKCHSGLKKYFSAATSQCFVNNVLDCEKDACQSVPDRARRHAQRHGRDLCRNRPGQVQGRQDLPDGHQDAPNVRKALRRVQLAVGRSSARTSCAHGLHQLHRAQLRPDGEKGRR